ncbi:MAG TPA: hypothetical protein ENJ19_11895 [Gammaproteobacteria bacterium]|nr:hypothetical protein [Gammaproteobacteria bacterium]
MSRHRSGFIDPFHTAEVARSYEGSVDLADMTRLASLLAAARGAASYEWQFDVDPLGTRHARGRITAVLPLLCQRCLEVMELDLDLAPRVAFVRSEEEIPHLGEEYDPCLVTRHDIALHDMVEDELLLAVPTVPRHDTGVCRIDTPRLGVAVEQEDVGGRPNPFAALKSLKPGR